MRERSVSWFTCFHFALHSRQHLTRQHFVFLFIAQNPNRKVDPLLVNKIRLIAFVL